MMIDDESRTGAPPEPARQPPTGPGGPAPRGAGARLTGVDADARFTARREAGHRPVTGACGKHSRGRGDATATAHPRPRPDRTGTAMHASTGPGTGGTPVPPAASAPVAFGAVVVGAVIPRAVHRVRRCGVSRAA
ncbi:hypothetical protein [Streptomyces malaysiense]|uniref:Uncharacterized protein n=1 Tax=Streptomyces malaysiense TaxID=1428626 RepID=A0A1J4PUE7_9ACTN|nr:hypothetical protein [Streptomyces malaysiense]OIK23742.1 hypothetical protein VT52_030965 [Streptomyces malaysiense]